MGEKYFTAFFSYLEQMEDMSDEEFGRVFRAAMVYAQSGTLPEGLSASEKMAFKFIKWNVDNSNAKKEATSKARSEASNTRWSKPSDANDANDANACFASNEMQTMQSDAKSQKNKKKKEDEEEDNTTSYEVVSAPDGANAQKQKRFVPPKIEDVRAYADENGLADDAERFVDYFESCGWVIGNSKKSMKDWKSAYRNWARNRDSYNPRAAPKQQSSDPLMEYLDRVIAGEE